MITGSTEENKARKGKIGVGIMIGTAILEKTHKESLIKLVILKSSVKGETTAK